jgi:hypothetical protein
MSEVKKCPKCGGEMVQGEFLKNLPKIIVSPKRVVGALIRSFPLTARNADSWKSIRK